MALKRPAVVKNSGAKRVFYDSASLLNLLVSTVLAMPGESPDRKAL
jgi:hypothetical protein